jgi:hypothetical protein
VLPAALAFDEAVLVVLPATVSDVDTDVHLWNWTQDGGAPVTLSSTSVAQPTFTTPAVTSPRSLRFSVVVSDGPESAAGFVDVTVRDNVNEEPLVDAGPDQLVDAGDLVQLSGSATDPNAETMTFAWVQRGGPGVTLSSTSVLTPTFIAPGSGGVLVFELSATDTRAGADVDSVSIDVTPAPVDAGAGDAGAGDAGAADAGAADAGAGVDAGRKTVHPERVDRNSASPFTPSRVEGPAIHLRDNRLHGSRVEADLRGARRAGPGRFSGSTEPVRRWCWFSTPASLLGLGSASGPPRHMRILARS